MCQDAQSRLRVPSCTTLPAVPNSRPGLKHVCMALVPNTTYFAVVQIEFRHNPAPRQNTHPKPCLSRHAAAKATPGETAMACATMCQDAQSKLAATLPAVPSSRLGLELPSQLPSGKAKTPAWLWSQTRRTSQSSRLGFDTTQHGGRTLRPQNYLSRHAAAQAKPSEKAMACVTGVGLVVC